MGWGFGVGGNVGGVGSRDVVRAALAVEYLAIPALRTTYYYSLGHLHTLRTLRTLAHNRAGSALGQVAQAVRAAAGRREGRAQGPPEGDKPWRQGEGGGPLQCMSRRLETLWWERREKHIGAPMHPRVALSALECRASTRVSREGSPSVAHGRKKEKKLPAVPPPPGHAREERVSDAARAHTRSSRHGIARP